MVKNFRNTKARQRELATFDKLWNKSKNRIYYRRKTLNIDFNPYLPIQSKRESKNLSTKELIKLNKQLAKITDKKSKFFDIVKFKNVNVPASQVREMRKLESQLSNIQKKMDERDRDRKIFLDASTPSDNDTVLSRRLMGTPSPSIQGSIKPYDFNNLKDNNLTDANIQRALESRRRRLDPEWVADKNRIIKENFMNSLIALFNDDADDVISRLKEIPDSDFYDMYQQFEPLDFAYVPSGSNTPTDIEKQNLHEIEEILDRYDRGEIDTSGKIFN